MSSAAVAIAGQRESAAGAGYRPDIDGLRAIAILSVAIFHAGVAGVPGGFTGVDIFFVISGYLIGGHIFAEASAGRFSFAFFYARRVRRILPALFALLAGLLAIGLLILTPAELKELGKESVPTVFGVSNLLFYTGGGYFAPAADLNPLLMTWSLGVEEQFYLFFPFVMLGVMRFGARLALPAILVLSLLSFAGSLVLMHVDPKAAFYLLPTRAWELGLGTALALWERRPGHAALPPALATTLSLVGAALLAVAILLYRPAFAFPGTFALLPTIGAALLIATRGGIVNRAVLSLPPVVFIGKVSYSWYLWHWPLFFLNRTLAEPGSGAPAVVLLLVSLALGILSWRFVEQPLRQRILPNPVVLRRYAIAAVAMTAPGLALYATGGLVQRLPAQARAFAEEARQARGSQCLATYGASAPRNLASCVPGRAGSGRLLVLGDSHASAIAPGFADVAARGGLAFGEITKSSCPPLWGYAREAADRRGHRQECLAFMESAFGYVRDHPYIRVVVLTGYWSAQLSVTDAAGAEVPLAVALERTVARLEALGRRVVLVQDVPNFRFDPYARVVGDMMPVRTAIAGLLRPAPGAGASGMASAEVSPDPTRPMLAGVAQAHPATMLVDPAAALRAAPGIRFRGADALYYFDFQHLTASGAREAVRGLRLPAAPAAAAAGE